MRVRIQRYELNMSIYLETQKCILNFTIALVFEACRSAILTVGRFDDDQGTKIWIKNEVRENEEYKILNQRTIYICRGLG
jgi:hypothetical protein